MEWTLWIIIGSISGALSVATGAFGAHALKDRLRPEDLAVFDTGARYQMIHALALLAVGLLAVKIDGTSIRIAGSAFALGSVLFSGSLYALALTGNRSLGIITPFGGAAFMVGWLAMAFAAFRT